MKYLYLLLLLTVCVNQTQSQTYDLQKLEEQFLRENFSILAQRFDIQKLEAAIIQEKLWSNPSFSISEVNLWANSTAETMSPLIGKYGKNQQFAVELEQLIETAGKRKKRVAIRKLEKETAALEFEELLLELKKELRQHFYAVQLYNTSLEQLKDAITLFEQLKLQYGRQSDKLNVSKADYYRIQVELISLYKEQLDIDTELEESLTTLRVLTQMPTLTVADLVFADKHADLFAQLPADVYALAKESNINLLLLKNEGVIAHQQLNLEKAERKPDVTAQVLYDRGSGTMQNFVGLGLQIDLPIFNRNKGNIKIAQYQIEQHKLANMSATSQVEMELSRLLKQLKNYETSLHNWQELETVDQKQLLESYKKHLYNKQLTLIEFIDYIEAYREAYQAQQELWRNYFSTYEDLQQLVGRDFN
ncbi:TolC family protein [Sphingobacterium sp. UT-1RO-CII-1]|uniref:TolC family protein n=1 Tax=Sphingobacterium sp. UT-1RO-CII-1 TaxID=2995225 RepID=UPI00227D1273|nr:TolC family protein [Sphingobacterium sp. UT-1RO-CII-1]MCY4781480.1 TolC family protein [Sphingobacterium sp. UT-1RO-CII-1]